MCGEKFCRRRLCPFPSISSPRVRGKVAPVQSVVVAAGIIPACAGKSVQAPVSVSDVRDHPRVCGEKYRPKIKSNQIKGSSPRVRGKAGSCAVLSVVYRIIPACAGKSITVWTTLTTQKDHPRVCGEKHEGDVISKAHELSSPRVRGKVSLEMRAFDLHRIIPACAGKRARDYGLKDTGEDHPRVCVEKEFVTPLDSMMLGSSPRVRGKVLSAAPVSVPVHIIPACAGKSCTCAVCCGCCWDHPRVCGEKCSSSRISFRCSGSSPRVRGKV